MVVCADPGALLDWEWVKWLPHLGHPHRRDALGAVRMVTADISDVRDWSIGMDPTLGLLLVLVAQPSRVADAMVRDGGPESSQVILEVSPRDVPIGVTDAWEATDTSLRRWGEAEPEFEARPDRAGAVTAAAVARRLARHDNCIEQGSIPDTVSATNDFARLMSLGALAEFSPERHQRAPAGPARLRVPIGVDDDGLPVLLDLKQAAEGGVGPHGLLIGATGSGKSELLRTLVLALTATHTSRSLNLVLIDFKGGAGFLGLRELPHVAAVITNLADEQVLVARMRDALAGEVSRRQELLRAAGNLASATDYQRRRRLAPHLPALPALVIICDEFTELLVQQPDLAELFVMLGRLGRSLSIHLLMASQRLEEGRMRGLDAHLSYRIALKTFSAADSRAVLEVDDAYRLPASPGVGFLKAGAAAPQRFRAAYVSAPAGSDPTPTELPSRAAGAPRRRVRLFTSRSVPGRTAQCPPHPPSAGAPGPDDPTVLDLWVRRLRGRGVPAHPVWLPPLDEAPLLDSLPVLGSATPAGRLRVAVGLVDRPYDQRRDPLWADFAGSTGHGLVVGGARAGKSTLLRAVVLALTRNHGPAEVQCYVVDLGGGELAALADLPHVGGVAQRDDPARVRRLTGQMTELMRAREAETARRLPGDGDRWPDVFLLIDGWSAFRADFDDLESQVTALVQRGLAHGIHVVLSTARWADLRPALKDLMGMRFELRLGDPTESDIDRLLAAAVPPGCPGRGLTPGGHHFRTAVPGRDDDPDALHRLVVQRRTGWPGSVAPPVRMLPDRLSIAELPAAGDHPMSIPIGVGESDLGTVRADFRTDPHLIVWGDAGSGRTTFLRTLAGQISSRLPPEQARLLIIDNRRTMLGVVDEAALAGYAATAAAARTLLAAAAELMTSRLPGGETTPEQLRERSWWSGAELFVLVDDHELVAAAGDPLGVLLPLLPHARDIGLHVVVCRRAAGGARAVYEPVLQQIRESGSPGLILSGPADEGALHGTQRARIQPPGRGFWVTRTGPTELVQLADSAG